MLNSLLILIFSTIFPELQIADLKVSVDSTEKERDFYFSKLRDIEILCQRPELERLPVKLIFNRFICCVYLLIRIYVCILG